MKFNFQKEPLEKFKLNLLPGALIDYLEQKNDSLTFAFGTKNISEYGNLTVNLKNVGKFPVIVELTNVAGEVIVSKYSEKETKIDFFLLEPSLYTLRVVYDENKNTAWDSGNYLEKRQPERIIYFPKDIDVRANWEVEQTFDLGINN